MLYRIEGEIPADSLEDAFAMIASHFGLLAYSATGLFPTLAAAHDPELAMRPPAHVRLWELRHKEESE